jgi:hypothetical protein
LANAIPELTRLERDPTKSWRLMQKRMPDGTVKNFEDIVELKRVF